MTSAEFKAHLVRQLTFLWRSCEAYDQGHIDEAVRIAAVIRVLLHDTSASTSLLNHLGALNIQLSSSVANFDRSKTVFMIGMGSLQMTDNETKRVVNTDLSSLHPMTVADWWNQVVYIAGSIRATRKSLILAAANKDGGAHVDPKLSPEYEALMHTGERGWFYYSPNNDGQFQPTINEHLLHIRQMGWELLNSPDLLALAQP